jgi:ribonucleotide reductase alpha subunit
MKKDLRLDAHIENILKERYYLKSETSWSHMATRLSETILPEIRPLIENRTFIPSTPTLMNLNTKGERKGTLSSCFILDINDSMDNIMDAMKECAFVTKAAGGVGYNFSKLRGATENVRSINANSGGVMAFIGIFDAILDGVRQGGRRRGAGMSMLSIYHPDILKFIDAKQKEGVYERSNFSVAPDTEFYEVLAKDPFRIFQTRNVVNGERHDLVDEQGKKYTYQMLWDKIIHNAWANAEPGIFNSDISADRCACKHITRNVFCNPCLTADTFVYVADGRGMVPIKTLVDEGKDVDVFSMNYDGKVVVKKMMNPRLTQKNAEVYKVTFDSGMSIKATAGHEFINTDGKRVQVKDLKIGESIKSVIRHQNSVGEAYFDKKEDCKIKNKGIYNFIENNGKLEGEHRVIAKNSFGDVTGKVVHHIDFNSQNNSPSNLAVLSYEEHNELHSGDRIGEKNPVHRIKDKDAWRLNISKAVSGVGNPNSKGISNKELVSKIKIHSKNTIFGLMCKDECLKIEGFPNLNTGSSLDKYRPSSFEDYCLAAGVTFIPGNVYSKLEKQVNVLSSGNYKYSLNSDYEIEISKNCDKCGKHFVVEFENRHVTYCSHNCLAKDKFKLFMFKDGKLSKQYLSNKNISRRLESTLKVYKAYKTGKFTNFKKEFPLANTIIRPNNIFCPSLDFLQKTVVATTCIEDLIKNAESNINVFENKKEVSKAIGESFNHKVVSIDKVGNEDVYDGTVEDTHCFFIGGNKIVNKFNRDSFEFILSSNCSEYVHIPYTSCNLGSINLSHFVIGGKMDWFFLKEMARRATVYLNGIIDQNDYPIEKIRKETMNVRPIGLGVMGFAHALSMLGIAYDSQEGYDFGVQVSRFITLAGMERSMELAKEHGRSYPYYDYVTFMDANTRFFTEDSYMGIDVAQLKKNIEKYGCYNSCITSIAPTGTISYIADCSSGIEPVFGLVFTRKIEKENKTYEHVYLIDPVFKKFVESKYPQDSEKIYKYVSGNKGSCQGCELLTEKEQAMFKVAGDISPEWHVKILASVANNVSLSVSKTINLPNNCSEKELGEVFLQAHKLGIIGVTVYRDGSRRGILVHDDSAIKIVKTKAPKRPASLKGEVHQFTVDGKKYYAAVGMLDDNPFEIFTGRNESKSGETYIPKYDEAGTIVKEGKSNYVFVGGDGGRYALTNGHSNDTADGLSRLCSVSLRHGADISFVVEQLGKVEGSMACYSKVLSRMLKKYIKDNTASTENCECGEKFIYVEGCKKCPACGNSKCG